MFILVRPLQLSKALPPILVTPLPIVIVLIPQLLNEDFPIVPDLINTETRLLLLANA